MIIKKLGKCKRPVERMFHFLKGETGHLICHATKRDHNTNKPKEICPTKSN